MPAACREMMTLGIVAREQARLEELRGLVAGLPVRLVLESAGKDHLESALQTAGRLRPEIMVVDTPLIDAASVIREIDNLSSGSDTILVLDDASSEKLLMALRAGAREFAAPPLSDSLPAAVHAVIRRRSIITEPRRGKIVGFLSAKGGCGSTSIAVHVAERIEGAKTLLADLDLEAGLVAFLLRIQSGQSILDAIRLGQVTGDDWNRLACSLPRFRYVLAAPPAGSADEPLPPGAVDRVLRSMRRHFDWTIADLGRGISSFHSQVLPEMDELYLVATPEVTSLYRAREIARWWTTRDLRPDRLHLVVNRMPARSEISAEDIEKALGRKVALTLPDTGMDLARAYQGGTLLPDRSPLARKLTDLARDIAGTTGRWPWNLSWGQ